MDKILITGSGGFVGSHLYNELKKEYDVVGVSKTKKENVDIVSDLSQIDFSDDFSVIVHTAALAWVDYCENHKEEAYEQNVNVTKRLVNYFKNKNTKFVYISTDYVYSGGKGTTMRNH